MALAPAARAQISPGPLARAHAKLEGSLQCVACHGSGGKTAMTGQCLACHKEIAWLTQRGRGLHGREGRAACAACHPDHAGSEFELIVWAEGDARRFDHGRAGWALEGSHREVACAKCHTPQFRRSPAAAAFRRSTPGWVGLEPDCATCHDDVHRGALDRDCATCHDQREWKPAPQFDHARTDYPLTGKHAEVRCEKCHLDPRLGIRTDAQGRAIPVYKPVSYRECSSCHQDPHRGALGARCGACHRTSGFGAVNREAFDHDRTRYPLRGRHASVSCASCHRDFSTAAAKKPGFATCTACHADPHAGTATLAGRVADCAACHGVQGWMPATYTVAQHREATYPLEGRHREVRCGSCHLRRPSGVSAARLGTSGVLMRPAAARCRDCHRDEHGHQLAAGRDGGECAACHAVGGWKPSTFGVAAHAKLRLALEGRHAEIPCAACHGARRSGLPAFPAGAVLGKAAVALRLREIECAACHADPHEGRFEARGRGARPQPGGCTACHDTRRFRPAAMDLGAHERLGFALEGAHRAIPCMACHRELERPGPASSSLVLGRPRPRPVTLAARKKTCEGCHRDPHGGQFANAACERCHGADLFRPATRFDHDRDAAFPLEGAHAKVACPSCHPARTGPDGRPLVTYRPVPAACESCHTGMRGRS
ncbi:MAG TPA: cytochrome c3 family protein [Gemmatimonadales bacterium]|nr:cytochrome c3 family protein [Gemmatimonadales bacterium]